MLYDPAQFEPLVDEPWNAARVEAAIAEIVADADAAFDPDTLWPAHEWDGWQAKLPMKNLYVGAAGVIWALARLRPFAESRLDLPAAAVRALEQWRREPDFTKGEPTPPLPEAGLFYGETGPLLVSLLLTPNASGADRLHELVRANLDSETNEPFAGAPGTLLAAAAMRDATDEERWDEAARATAAAVAARRDDDGLWTQRLWGQEFRAIGASHGVVANVRALLHVEDPRNDALRRETAALLAGEARREDGLANWTDEPRLQWCVGAPGILVAAWDYLDEELLLAGADVIWQAGAHGDEKGHGICHGTSGNGFALLKTFARTGDELWLERARRLAVHALAQAERLAAANGRRRYSLFTGDVGTALFAAACLDCDPRYPVLDIL
ncbi:MAG TPA: lanthionine synthetase LanC family protein [Gaiellaceae bacterium]|nr:lanthionine synthetase LanC family protein [Gaiellaceae bacterium]